MALRNSDYMISYMAFRKLVGWVAIALPIVVWVGAYVRETIPMQDSISAYYYTSMRDLFVGFLCAVGVYLVLYRGVSKLDNTVTTIAGAAVMSIALLPMDPTYDPIIKQQFSGLNSAACYVNHGPLKFHFVASVVFFSAISFLVTFRFPRTKEPLITPQKTRRNKVYFICGVTMFLGIVTIGIQLLRHGSIFWPETITIGAFGVAWLTKGQLILKDDERQRTIRVASLRNRWGWGKGSQRQDSPIEASV
jgi:hypothetical protein